MMEMLQDLLATHGWLIIAMLAAGCATGFAAGLFGIGGGVITVPVLYAVFSSLEIADGPSLKSAIGTSLAVIVVTSIGSLITHHRAGHVDGKMLAGWAPYIAVGSALGGAVAHWVPAEALAVIFAGGGGYIAWRRIARKERGPVKELDLHARHMKIPFGLGAGLFSSLMGLGGGAVGVMVMTLAGRPMHQAIATSAGFGLAVAIPGAAAFVIAGRLVEGLPPGAIGYVNIPAFLAVALTAGLMAPVGAKLAHQLNGALLSKIFGVYVALAALALLMDVFF